MISLDKIRTISRNAFIGINVGIFAVLVALAMPSVSPLLTAHPDKVEAYSLPDMNQPEIDDLAVNSAAQAYADEEGLRTVLRSLPVIHLLAIGAFIIIRTRRNSHAI